MAGRRKRTNISEEEKQDALRKLEVILKSRTVYAPAMEEMVRGLHDLMLEEQKDKALPQLLRNSCPYWKKRTADLVRNIKIRYGIKDGPHGYKD